MKRYLKESTMPWMIWMWLNNIHLRANNLEVVEAGNPGDPIEKTLVQIFNSLPGLHDSPIRADGIDICHPIPSGRRDNKMFVGILNSEITLYILTSILAHVTDGYLHQHLPKREKSILNFYGQDRIVCERMIKLQLLK